MSSIARAVLSDLHAAWMRMINSLSIACSRVTISSVVSSSERRSRAVWVYSSCRSRLIVEGKPFSKAVLV